VASLLEMLPRSSGGARTHGAPVVDAIDVGAYTIPTETPESDGTLGWRRTTIVVVEPRAGDVRGVGYTYADTATAALVRDLLAGVVRGVDATAVPAAWARMVHAIRNLGRPGIVSTAIAAVDNALWDLKARLLGVPLATLLGAARDAVAIYGSGGFTSESPAELERQLGGWADAGIARVKMKIGRRPADDVERVRIARAAIGPTTELFVDANGAYDRKQALAQAEAFARYDVAWFEEPVTSDDLPGLRLLRDRAPAGMAIAAGEYGYDLGYFARMLDAEAVDVLQADATRCGGVSEFLRVGALCAARHVPLSAHTAPALHLHPCCALEPVRHVEWFADHVRIERMLFDGAPVPAGGTIAFDPTRPGLGLELKRRDADRYRVF